MYHVLYCSVSTGERLEAFKCNVLATANRMANHLEESLGVDTCVVGW